LLKERKRLFLGTCFAVILGGFTKSLPCFEIFPVAGGAMGYMFPLWIALKRALLGGKPCQVG